MDDSDLWVKNLWINGNSQVFAILGHKRFKICTKYMVATLNEYNATVRLRVSSLLLLFKPFGFVLKIINDFCSWNCTFQARPRPQHCSSTGRVVR